MFTRTLKSIPIAVCLAGTGTLGWSHAEAKEARGGPKHSTLAVLKLCKQEEKAERAEDCERSHTQGHVLCDSIT